jgi:DNA-binding CsgD family transcriptional regulator
MKLDGCLCLVAVVLSPFSLSLVKADNSNRPGLSFVHPRPMDGTRLKTERPRMEAPMPTTSCPPNTDHQGAQGEAVSLSNRQQQILSLVAEGRTDNEIAQQLCISVQTVAWHVREIRAQFGARSRAHAVALALRQGIPLGRISPDPHP